MSNFMAIHPSDKLDNLIRFCSHTIFPGQYSGEAGTGRGAYVEVKKKIKGSDR